MNYKQLKKRIRHLKCSFGACKEMKEHYQDLFSCAVDELHFEKCQRANTEELLKKVEQLVKHDVYKHIILKVIKNGKEKIQLETDIHNNLIAKQL